MVRARITIQEIIAILALKNIVSLGTVQLVVAVVSEEPVIVGSDDGGATDFRITKEKCILCGACAVNCPNDAIKVVDRSDERILSLCGTILNRQKLIYCNSCGEPVGTDQYLDHLKNRLSTTSQVKYDKNLCGVCARKERAARTNQWGARTPALFQ